MMRHNKSLAMVISIATALAAGILLLYVFEIFDLETRIALSKPFSTKIGRSYEHETDSVATFIGCWHYCIMFLSGFITYILIAPSDDTRKIYYLFAFYLFISSSTILIPAEYISNWLDNFIISDRLFNFMDFILILIVGFCFYLYWRSFQSKKSQISGFKLWILKTEHHSLYCNYIIEAKTQEEAIKCVEIYLRGETILSISEYYGALKILKFRTCNTDLIQTFHEYT